MTAATRILLDEKGLPRRQVRTYRLEVQTPKGPARSVDIAQPQLRVGAQPLNDLVLDDPAVSRVHLDITMDEHGFRLRDLESRNGTFVDGVRARDVYLRPGARIRLGQSELAFFPAQREAEVPASPSDRFGPLVGRSVAMREAFALLERAAPSDATVLIEGETGTGKELVARALHDHSPRVQGPFVVLDCAAVQPHLLDSELFGHEKGAFTGAAGRRVGRLEEADGGTLFIDELGELPIELQPKLLRALERREVRPLGSRRTLAVDIRVVAATHRDLASAINRGAFREDLYYRLAVVRVRLPALRERREDVRLLAEHVIRTTLSDAHRADRVLASISDANWQRLEAHPWPGNVRQLRNVIQRTLALTSEDEVRAREVAVQLPTEPPVGEPGRGGQGDAPAGSPEPARPSPAAHPAVDLSQPFVDHKAAWVAHFERAYLEGQLAAHQGNVSRAAAASGMDRMYFKRVLKKYR